MKAIWRTGAPTKDGLYWGMRKGDKTETPTPLLRKSFFDSTDKYCWRCFYVDESMTQEEVEEAYYFGDEIPPPDTCENTQPPVTPSYENGNNPAFPVECQFSSDGKVRGQQTGSYSGWEIGLTKREKFAAMAMEALITSKATYYNEFDLHKEAVYHADALLGELAKPKPQPPIQQEGWSTLPTHWLIVNKRLYVVGISSGSKEMAWKTAVRLMRGEMSESVLRKECRCVRAEITVQGLPS